MKRFEKPIRIGTMVKIEGIADPQEVIAFHNDRKLISVKNKMGQFQRGHVENYTNQRGHHA